MMKESQKVVELLMSDVSSKQTIDYYAELSFMSRPNFIAIIHKRIGNEFQRLAHPNEITRSH